MLFVSLQDKTLALIERKKLRLSPHPLPAVFKGLSKPVKDNPKRDLHFFPVSDEAEFLGREEKRGSPLFEKILADRTVVFFSRFKTPSFSFGFHF
jgi:hypothetical protein